MPTPTPEPTPSLIPVASPRPTPDLSPSPTPTPIVTGALPGAGPSGGSGGGRSDGSGGAGGSSPVVPPADVPVTWSPMGSVASALGLGGWRPLPPLQFVPTLVTTTTFAAGMMGMSIFAKRRREEDELDDDVLAAHAASGLGMDESVAVAVAAAIAAVPEIPDVEAGMPRWRRPSLLQARKADPIRDAVEASRLTFDNGLIGPIEGRERHLIKYDIVTLLDAPDEPVPVDAACRGRDHVVAGAAGGSPEADRERGRAKQPAGPPAV